MKPVPIAVAAWILAAVGFCPPAQAVPQGLPHGMHAPAVPWLLRARYRRHRHYRRHDEQSVAATDADGRATDDSTIKPGQWEFAAQLEAAALAAPGSSAALGAASFGGGATKSTYAICVAADNAVPSAFVAGCELDAVHRDGGRITWSMTCTNPQNAVRSDGVAQYQGDTMTATMVSHLPSGHLPSGHLPSGHLPSGQLPSGKTGDKAKGGKTIDVAQYITGRYLGPCPNTTTAAATTASAAGTAAAPIAAAPPAPAPANATGAAAAATAAVPPAPAPTAPPPTNATGSPAAPGAAARVAATPPPAAPTEGATSVATSPALPAEPETSTAARTEASEPRRREEHIARHRHYHRYRRHYAYRRRYRGAYGGGFYGNGTYSGFGPSPYSANGY